MSNVVDKIDSTQVIELTRELIRIPSENPPGNEEAIADFIAEKMRESGLSVEKHECRPHRPNVIGHLVGTKRKPSLMLNGHLDTVPIGDRDLWQVDPLSAETRNGKIYGRGASDMKAAMAAMIIAAKAIIDSGQNLGGNLLVAAVADEEVGGLGTRKLLHERYRSDMAVIGEPTELRVQVAHKGTVRLEIMTRGRAAHASQPHMGVNAIYGMAGVCLALRDFAAELERRRHPLLGSPTINVGTIRGGTKTNIVPEVCKITVDRRLIPGEKPGSVKMEVDRVLQQVVKGDAKLELESKIQHVVEPSETHPEEAIVKIAREAVKKIVGKDPGVTGFPATCDMVHLVKAGIPTIILGPGTLSQAHTTNEFIEASQIVDATKIYALMALEALR